MKKVICKECVHFCPRKNSKNTGECRLNPPVFVRAKDGLTYGVDLVFARPEMENDNWCGQGQPIN